MTTMCVFFVFWWTRYTPQRFHRVAVWCNAWLCVLRLDIQEDKLINCVKPLNCSIWNVAVLMTVPWGPPSKRKILQKRFDQRGGFFCLQTINMPFSSSGYLKTHGNRWFKQPGEGLWFDEMLWRSYSIGWTPDTPPFQCCPSPQSCDHKVCTLPSDLVHMSPCFPIGIGVRSPNWMKTLSFGENRPTLRMEFHLVSHEWNMHSAKSIRGHFSST